VAALYIFFFIILYYYFLSNRCWVWSASSSIFEISLWFILSFYLKKKFIAREFSEYSDYTAQQRINKFLSFDWCIGASGPEIMIIESSKNTENALIEWLRKKYPVVFLRKQYIRGFFGFEFSFPNCFWNLFNTSGLKTPLKTILTV
jgi:hypothetical protein